MHRAGLQSGMASSAWESFRLFFMLTKRSTLALLPILVLTSLIEMTEHHRVWLKVACWQQRCLGLYLSTSIVEGLQPGRRSWWWVWRVCDLCFPSRTSLGIGHEYQQSDRICQSPPFCAQKTLLSPSAFSPRELGVPRGFPHVCWALSLLTAMTYLNSIPLLSWIPAMNTLAAADAKNSSCASRQKHHSSCFCCCHCLPDWDGSCLQKKMSLDLPSAMIPNVKGTDIQPQLQGGLLPLVLQLALLLLLSLFQVPLLVPVGLIPGPLGTSKGKQIFHFYFSPIKILPFIDSVMSS